MLNSMFTLAEQHDVDTMLRQGWGLAAATAAIIDRRHGRPTEPRRAGLTAAEVEIRRLQAAAGQPRSGAPAAPSDVNGVRAQRQALNDWSREQALETAARMREQRGGWGR